MTPLETILARLREQNPLTADRFTLDRHQSAVGYADPLHPDIVFMLYSHVIGRPGVVVDCRFPDGRYLTHPAADW